MHTARAARPARLAPCLVALVALLVPAADADAAPQRRAHIPLAEHRAKVALPIGSGPREFVRASLRVLRALDRQQLRPRV